MNYINLTRELGYAIDKLPKSLFLYLKELAESQKGKEKVNHKLAGNIEEEYGLKITDKLKNKEFVDYLHDMRNLYQQNSVYESEIFGSLSNLSLKLDNLWVNYQKKYEFNPLHNHSGVYSFVIWIKIPYDYRTEKTQEHCINSQNNFSSDFAFVYPTAFDMLITHNIGLDKNYEGAICFFPSNLHHCVFPFYTSDDYRISISGNLSFNIQRDKTK